MKKYLILILSVVYVQIGFSQNLSKKIDLSLSGKEKESIELVFPHESKTIIVVRTYDYKKMIIEVYDNNFKLLKSKEEQTIESFKKYYITSNHLYIKSRKLPDNNYEITRINIDDLTVNTYSLKGNYDVNNQFDLALHEKTYGTSTLLKVFDFNKDNLLQIELNKENKDILEIVKSTIIDENKLFIIRSRGKNYKKVYDYEYAIYDFKGEEKLSGSIIDGENFLKSYQIEKITDGFLLIGNYIINPTKKEKDSYIEKDKNVNYDGIYVKKIGGTNPQNINKFFKYVDFKNFNKKLIENKDINNLSKLSFSLDNIVEQGENKIVAGTVYKNIWGVEGQNKVYIGREIEYVLVFVIDGKGELLWDKAFHIDSKKVQYNKWVFETLDLDYPITLQLNGDKIVLHFPFNEAINYYVLEEGKIITEKEIKFEKIDDAKGYDNLVEQYRSAKYWYDGYYFSFIRRYRFEQEGGAYLYLNKIQFD